MSQTSRFAAAFCLACLVFAGSSAPRSSFAQNAAPVQPAPTAPQMKQMALTEKQVSEVPATQKELDAITDKLPDSAPDKPDAKVLAQLEAVARKHGYASYAEYNEVIDNVSLVLDGVDPQTKKFVGFEAMIKQQVAAVQADKDMPAKDKKEALDELNQALKNPAPVVQNTSNIDLVIKYYDRLIAVLQDTEE